jgi:hypothetical protein
MKEDEMEYGKIDNRMDAGARRHTVGRGALLPAIVVAVCGLTLLSCATTGKGSSAGAPGTSAAAERIAAVEPQPGATKMMNGVEYIYARNRRWTPVSGESEYVWIRKDLYSPGLFESLKESSVAEQKEMDDLKKRIERLEEELGKSAG